MRLPFARQALSWLRSSGHGWRSVHKMQARVVMRQTVSLAIVGPPTPLAVAGAAPGAAARLGVVGPRAWSRTTHELLAMLESPARR